MSTLKNIPDGNVIDNEVIIPNVTPIITPPTTKLPTVSIDKKIFFYAALEAIRQKRISRL